MRCTGLALIMAKNQAPRENGAGDDDTASSSSDVRVHQAALLTAELAENCATNMFTLHADGPHAISSRVVDPDAVDHAAFPLFAGAPYCDLVLAAGEVLYIPPRWWHLVESRELSFSVNFWW